MAIILQITDDQQCPNEIGSRNAPRKFWDISRPTPEWISDDTITFECFSEDYKLVNCSCTKYNVYHLDYEDKVVPGLVSQITGTYESINVPGILAPVYYEKIQDEYLYSQHPHGKVWIFSSKISQFRRHQVRINFDEVLSCPDSSNSGAWERLVTHTDDGQDIFVKDEHIKVKCIDD